MTVQPGEAVDAAGSQTPGTAQEAYEKGRKLNDAGRPTEAIPLLQAALQLDAAHEGAVIELGNTLMDIGKRQAAMLVFEETLEAHPGLIGARLSFGNALMRSGELDRAVQELERCVGQQPGWDAPYMPLIAVLCRLHRVAEARARLTSLREISANAAQLDMLQKLVDRTAREN